VAINIYQFVFTQFEKDIHFNLNAFILFFYKNRLMGRNIGESINEVIFPNIFFTSQL